MKKFFRVMVYLFAVLGIFLAIYFGFKLINPKPIELTPGWQKLEEINGVIPKGAIMVVSDSSNLVLPGDSETKEQTGFVREGIVIFYTEKHCVSEGSVYVYYPTEEYSTLFKADDLLVQANEKLSELTGKQNENQNLYFVGTP